MEQLQFHLEMLWLKAEGGSDAAVIAVDSLYAANQAEGWWRMNKNQELIRAAQGLLKEVRRSRDVTFVHVKGHSGDVGNDRADRLVQWGKTPGPFSRFDLGGGGEGEGRTGPVTGHLRSVKEAGEEIRHELVLGEGDTDEYADSDEESRGPNERSAMERRHSAAESDSGSVLRVILGEGSGFESDTDSLVSEEGTPAAASAGAGDGADRELEPQRSAALGLEELAQRLSALHLSVSCGEESSISVEVSNLGLEAE